MLIITGASKGIGKYLFDHYSQRGGEEVIGTYRAGSGFDNKSGYYKVDISDPVSVRNWIDKIADRLSNITLINSAGINYNSFAHKAELEPWSEVIQVNLIGTFNVIRSLLPYMRNQNKGRIINISSIVAQKGIMGTSAYAASKAGLWGMTKALAAENASKGITVNCLNLGYMDLGMTHELPKDFKETVLKSIPVGKFGRPEDLISTMDYLIKTEYITGTSIDINGGLF